ncbi:MAG: phytoene/squalene synthase family protein [Myxococcota bacterium]
MPTPFDELRSDDLQACRNLLHAGSKSFSLASLLLPKRVREPAAAVYAFCRIADDLIDEAQGGKSAVAELEHRLELIYRRTPLEYPVDRAFTAVVHHYGIPRQVPAALVEGFAWDVEGRTYETMEDLQAYAARVAGTVGVMMTLLMGPRDPQTLERACDLGVAMQLTNIARDVGQDARDGRVYLPSSWLRDAGVESEAFLRDPAFRPEVAMVIRQVLERAELLYARSDLGIVRLPQDCQPAIRAARLIYSEIGHELERRGLDSVSQRTVVGKGRKLWLVLRALLGRAPGERAPLLTPYQPLEETRFLVQASAHPRPLQLQEAQ